MNTKTNDYTSYFMNCIKSGIKKNKNVISLGIDKETAISIGLFYIKSENRVAVFISATENLRDSSLVKTLQEKSDDILKMFYEQNVKTRGKLCPNTINSKWEVKPILDRGLMMVVQHC